jgi:hypothetical protein
VNVFPLFAEKMPIIADKDCFSRHVLSCKRAFIICDSEQIAGQLLVTDRKGLDVTAQDYYAVATTRINCASHFWQDICLDQCTDNLIEFDLRQIIQEKLPKVWQWCDISTKNRCVPNEVLTVVNGVSAWFTAKESMCVEPKLFKHSEDANEVFFNWFTGRGYVRIKAQDSVHFESRLHELIWDFRIKDGAGAILAKAKGILYFEPSIGGVC